MDAAAGTELYVSYEQDYLQLSESIQSKLNHELKNQRGDARRSTARAIERELEEADELVRKTKFKQYKTDMAGARTTLKNAQTSFNRDDLLHSESRGANLTDDAHEGGGQGENDQRQRLLSGTERLQDGSRRLQDAHRVALETETVGADILNNLYGQRSTIEHARGTLGEADTSIGKASRTLGKMIRRAKVNKAVTVGILVVLAVCIIVVIIGKFL